MLIGLAESCTFTADSIEFLDATGTRCKVEFDLARALHRPAVPLGRQPPWPPRNHGTLDPGRRRPHRHP